MTEAAEMAAAAGTLEATEEAVLKVGQETLAIASEEASLTVAAVAGVSIMLLLVIAALFIAGFLIDCRVQRIIDQNEDNARRLRLRTKRRDSIETEKEDVGFTKHMVGPATSDPPASAIFNTV